MKITLLTGQTFDFSSYFGFEIKVVRSGKAKRLTLRIDEKNKCPVVTLPKYCSKKQALEFLQNNQDWMVNMLARLPSEKKFSNGEEFCFWGEKYVVLHEVGYKGAKFENGFLKIGGDKTFLHRRVCDFIKEKALKKLAEETVKKAKNIGCKVCGVAIKDTKSRWGSCSSLGNINYNWRIVLAPKFVIEYLICHEVCHLKHQNHSKDFWQELENMCKNFEDGRHWLKIKGKELYKYV